MQLLIHWEIRPLLLNELFMDEYKVISAYIWRIYISYSN